MAFTGLKSRYLQGCVSSGGTRRESTSLSFLATRDQLFFLVCSLFLHLQSQECSILKSLSASIVQQGVRHIVLCSKYILILGGQGSLGVQCSVTQVALCPYTCVLCPWKGTCNYNSFKSLEDSWENCFGDLGIRPSAKSGHILMWQGYRLMLLCWGTIDLVSSAEYAAALVLQGSFRTLQYG